MVASQWKYPASAKSPAQKAAYRKTHFKNGKKKASAKTAAPKARKAGARKAAAPSTTIRVKIPRRGPSRVSLAKEARCIKAKARVAKRLAVADRHADSARRHAEAAARHKVIAEKRLAKEKRAFDLALKKAAHAEKASKMALRNC